jgi:hypothetical protein
VPSAPLSFTFEVQHSFPLSGRSASHQPPNQALQLTGPRRTPIEVWLCSVLKLGRFGPPWVAGPAAERPYVGRRISMLQIPKSEEEVLRYLDEHRRWISTGDPALVPEFLQLEREEEKSALCQLLAGLFVHAPVSALRFLAEKLRLWWLVILLAQFRIRISDLGQDSVHCSRNVAYDALGYGYFRLGRYSQAEHCLDMAWRIYPCPHNTTYGLRMRLCRALQQRGASEPVVERYLRLAEAFVRE